MFVEESTWGTLPSSGSEGRGSGCHGGEEAFIYGLAGSWTDTRSPQGILQPATDQDLRNTSEYGWATSVLLSFSFFNFSVFHFLGCLFLSLYGLPLSVLVSASFFLSNLQGRQNCFLFSTFIPAFLSQLYIKCLELFPVSHTEAFSLSILRKRLISFVVLQTFVLYFCVTLSIISFVSLSIEKTECSREIIISLNGNNVFALYS